MKEGDKRGRLLGFPTANLALPKRFLPKFGIYAVRIYITGNASPLPAPPSLPLRIAPLHSPDVHGKQAAYNGVANIGIRPMYATKVPLLEAYLFDFSGDLYGSAIEVQCIGYLRGEIKFASEKELMNAMNDDVRKAKTLLGDVKAIWI